MPETEATLDLRLVPMLDFLARVGGRAAQNALGDLRPRHLTALAFLREQGPTGQQSMIEALSLDPSNVVGLLNDLEEHGFVTRRRDPADRRRHVVEVLPDGLEALDHASTALTFVENDLFAVLSVAERKTLTALVRRVVAANHGPRVDDPADPGAC